MFWLMCCAFILMLWYAVTHKETLRDLFTIGMILYCAVQLIWVGIQIFR